MMETLRTGSAPRLKHPDQSMARLMVGRAPSFGFWYDDVAGRTELNLLRRVGQVAMRNGISSSPCGQQGGLVHQVGKIGARHAGRRGG